MAKEEESPNYGKATLPEYFFPHAFDMTYLLFFLSFSLYPTYGRVDSEP